ncbi:MAG: DNA translocase FtsK [Floccifex sp.]
MAKAKKKKSSSKKNTKQQQTNWGYILTFVCFIVFSIIAICQFGIVGKSLYRLVSFLFGYLAIPVCIGIIFVSGYSLMKDIRSLFENRYWIGILCIFLATSLLLAILEFKPNSASYGITYTMANFVNTFKGTITLKSGVLGSLLMALFVGLLDYNGSYFIVGVGYIAGVICIGFNGLKKLVEEKPKIEKPVRIKKEKPQKQESIFLDYDEKKEKKSSLFIEADPVMEKEEKIEVVHPEIKEEPTQKEEPVHYVVDYSNDYSNYKLVNLRSVLDPCSRRLKKDANMSNANKQGTLLIDILNQFGVNAKLVDIHIGPSVTKFEIKPELGVRVSKIANLQDDIKMALAAKEIRIEAPIPGKSAVGIEIPNETTSTVQMMDLMMSIPSSLQNKSLLFCLGKDLSGENIYGLLDKMPHLLIAGATGSGKSVCVNSIICSLLLRTRPDEVKLILIDPKKVEFTPYNDVPHLLAPVITDGDLANKALKVIVKMMDDRYELFGRLGVRNIQAYNMHLQQHPEDSLKPLPWIVVIIDELADLMLVAAKEVEASIQRITQLARAAGIHLIVATQRPSVDVITGVIKANIPSRIAFAVSSSVDSRTILDQVGAEKLLGNGDMLYLPNGQTTPSRVQGVFIKDEEVNKIAQAIKAQAKPNYDDTLIGLKDLQMQGQEVNAECADPLYNDVKAFVIQSQKASTSFIQRRFSIGYSRAARLMDVLEENGIIGPSNGSKPREVLVKNNVEDGMD